MTEYEILDLVASNGEALSSSFSVYLSLISAYIAVAYLVGAKLSRFQFASLTILFMYGGWGQALGQYNINRQNSDLFSQLSGIRALTPFEDQYVVNGTTWAAVMVIGVLIAVGFMWSVRSSKNE